ncbi:MAG: hypothetical protein QOG63_2996 [Thermoleophilaceae bacterium]|jgi:hypothetical protein|nr:hypothetical protein [Thermoleophilaceae bacterium]
MATVDDVRRLALGLPESNEKPCYGTPGFYVRNNLFARIRSDDETVVVKVDIGERELLMGAEPETFFITDHYREYPSVLVRLEAIEEDELLEVLTDSWRRVAPKRLLAAFDAEHPAA